MENNEKSAEDTIADLCDDSVRRFAVEALKELQDQIGDTYKGTIETVVGGDVG